VFHGGDEQGELRAEAGIERSLRCLCGGGDSFHTRTLDAAGDELGKRRLEDMMSKPGCDLLWRPSSPGIAGRQTRAGSRCGAVIFHESLAAHRCFIPAFALDRQVIPGNIKTTKCRY